MLKSLGGENRDSRKLRISKVDIDISYEMFGIITSCSWVGNRETYLWAVLRVQHLPTVLKTLDNFLSAGSAG